MGKPVYDKKVKQHPDGWLEQGKESRKFRKQLIIKRGTNVKDQVDEHSGHKMTMNTFNNKKILINIKLKPYKTIICSDVSHIHA